MNPLEIIKRDKKKWDKLLELVETQLTKIKDILQKIDDALRFYYNEATDEIKEQLKDPLNWNLLIYNRVVDKMKVVYPFYESVIIKKPKKVNV